MKTVVIIPTYNERANIEALVKALLAQDNIEIIIVDDNSPDGTGQIADELSRRHPGVHVIHRPAKLGLGTAHIAGFRKALAMGADRILTMDADFSHHPRYIPALLAGSQSCDLVIGSRYVEGGGTLGCNLARRLLSWGGNAFARLVLGLKARDCTAGFRCYRREVLQSIDLGQVFSDGYSFLIEMLYKCQQGGWRIGEVPILFENRRRGASKISRREVFKAAYTVLRLGCERVLSGIRSALPGRASNDG